MRGKVRGKVGGKACVREGRDVRISRRCAACATGGACVLCAIAGCDDGSAWDRCVRLTTALLQPLHLWLHLLPEEVVALIA